MTTTISDHVILKTEPALGNMLRWTCSCGKTGVAGPGMPSQLERLARTNHAGHRSRETKTTT